MHITLANQLYSSWSLRPWLVLHAFDIAFSQTVIPLRQPDSEARIAAVSPTGLLPVLEHDGVKVWEALAIIHYLAEYYPDRAIWPQERDARAMALSISAEMAGGFGALRAACPMNLGKRFAPQARDAAVEKNVARICMLVSEARDSFGQRADGTAAGPFLFGAFSAADAMYAPVVTRLDTYQFDVPGPVRAYMDAVLAHPSFQAWKTQAFQEPWRIPAYEEGLTVVETFVTG